VILTERRADFLAAGCPHGECRSLPLDRRALPTTGLEEALPVIAFAIRTKPVALLVAFALSLGLVSLSGCETQSYSEELIYPVREDPLIEEAPKADPPHFARPGQWSFLLPIFEENGGKKLDPTKLTSSQRAAFQKMLDEHFGTPAKPTVKGIDEEAKQKLRLDDATLARGSHLYRRHCLHCHGLSGDGHGPTAPWVNPHPRDYRPGKFKFMSTLGTAAGDKGRKPSRADLLRTLKQGVEGTSMPSFGLLPEEELNDIISYVMHLSIRGQVEYQLMRELFASNSDPSKIDASSVNETLGGAGDVLNDRITEWTSAESQPIPVVKTPVEPTNLKSPEGQESIKRGHQLFLGLGVNQASCVSCHADYGRQNAYKYDEWGTVVRPRDLTLGLFRGGRRPIDVYYRIFNGINGTPMPAFLSPGQEKDEKKMQQVWDLVNFIQALPYPGMLPDDVRRQIYASDQGGEAHAAVTRRD
jgi:mono/diheme cytochrome c family protein